MVAPDKVLGRVQVRREVVRNGQPRMQKFWVKPESARRNKDKPLPTPSHLVEEAMNTWRNPNGNRS